MTTFVLKGPPASQANLSVEAVSGLLQPALNLSSKLFERMRLP